jgi:hypothetical protein
MHRSQHIGDEDNCQNQGGKPDDSNNEAEKDEEIRKAAWKEMIAALKKAREEKEEKERH